MDIQPITISIERSRLHVVHYRNTTRSSSVRSRIKRRGRSCFADSAAVHLPSIVYTTVLGSRCVASRDQDGIVDTIAGYIDSSSWLDGVARFSMSNEVAEYTSSRDRITSAEDQAKYSIDGLPVDRIFDEMSGSVPTMRKRVSTGRRDK